VQVVIDTNVFLSALLNSNGNPAKVINCVLDESITLATSEHHYKEIVRVLGYAHTIKVNISADEVIDFIEKLKSLGQIFLEIKIC
jgi:putative PIN family toxin of toxin-antitoxin system